ncbi:virulence RhuM family protein [Patescibacteria group bacterium]|nr:virulence RhuM family protein [Patescibacteria group bacterium]
MPKKVLEKKNIPSNVVVYQTKSGALELRGDFKHEMVWATQAQIADVFEIDRTVATKHINNTLRSSEVDENNNVQKMHIANSKKPISLYSLDIILAVGYRTNSAKAIEFRQWATKTLRQHIVSGYTINRARIAKNYDEFMATVAKLQAVLPNNAEIDSKTTLDLVRLFADTWFSLDAYDKESLAPSKVNKKKLKLTAKELQDGIVVLKTELMRKGEATNNFAQERNHEALEGIVGNVMQSFGGNELYPSIQSKAAHLLYFIIKNHPFVDGNKRSGAYAFVWFLQKTKVLNTNTLTPTALTALTILIAESNPVDKEKIIALVTTLISG